MLLAASLCNTNPRMNDPIVMDAVHPYSGCNTSLANSMNHPVARVAVNTIAHTLGGVGVAVLIINAIPIGIGAAVGAVTGLVSSIAIQIFNRLLPAHMLHGGMAQFIRILIPMLLATLVGVGAVALGAPVLIIPGAVLLGIMTNFMMRALATFSVATACCAGFTANTANEMVRRLDY